METLDPAKDKWRKSSTQHQCRSSIPPWHENTARHKKLFRNTPRNKTKKSWRCLPDLILPEVQIGLSNVGCACKISIQGVLLVWVGLLCLIRRLIWCLSQGVSTWTPGPSTWTPGPRFFPHENVVLKPWHSYHLMVVFMLWLMVNKLVCIIQYTFAHLW